MKERCNLPDSASLRLHTLAGVDNDKSGIDGGETALHLKRKIDVARRVDQMDVVLAPG